MRKRYIAALVVAAACLAPSQAVAAVVKDAPGVQASPGCAGPTAQRPATGCTMSAEWRALAKKAAKRHGVRARAATFGVHNYEWPPAPWTVSTGVPNRTLDCDDDAYHDDPFDCMPLTNSRIAGPHYNTWANGYAYGNYPVSPAGVSGSDTYLHMAVGGEALGYELPAGSVGSFIQLGPDCAARAGWGSNTAFRVIMFNTDYSLRYSSTHIRPAIGLVPSGVWWASLGGDGQPHKVACVYSAEWSGSDLSFINVSNTAVFHGFKYW